MSEEGHKDEKKEEGHKAAEPSKHLLKLAQPLAHETAARLSALLKVPVQDKPAALKPAEQAQDAAPCLMAVAELSGDLQSEIALALPLADAAALGAAVLGAPLELKADQPLSPEAAEPLQKLATLLGDALAAAWSLDKLAPPSELKTGGFAPKKELSAAAAGMPEGSWAYLLPLKFPDAERAIRILFPGPTASALSAKLAALKKVNPVAPGAKGKILIVDDHYSIRALMRRHLVKLGYEVTEAGSGAEALRKFQTDKPMAVISDVMMPEMDGFELCRRIRKTHDKKAVPIIMCTGKGQGQDVTEAIQAGANDYIVKPFTQEVLIGKLEKALKSRQA